LPNEFAFPALLLALESEISHQSKMIGTDYGLDIYVISFSLSLAFSAEGNFYLSTKNGRGV
jgi:hypothetical protein